MAFLETMYESHMKDTLYAVIEKDEQHGRSLKAYVDDMYKREWYYEMFVLIEIFIFMIYVFFWVCVPAVSQILNGGAI